MRTRKSSRTDRRTDRRTDGQTDGQTKATTIALRSERPRGKRGKFLKHKSTKFWKRVRILHVSACFHPGFHLAKALIDPVGGVCTNEF